MRPGASVVSLVAAVLLPSFAAAQSPPPQPLVPRVELAATIGPPPRVPQQDTFLASGGMSRRVSVDVTVGSRASIVFAPLWVQKGSGVPLSYSWVAGPRIRFGEGRRVRPFAEALGGVVRGPLVRTGSPVFGARREQRTAFQSSCGGGTDIRVNDRFFVRAVEVEARTITGEGGYTTMSVWTGVVVRFGARRD